MPAAVPSRSTPPAPPYRPRRIAHPPRRPRTTPGRRGASRNRDTLVGQLPVRRSRPGQSAVCARQSGHPPTVVVRPDGTDQDLPVAAGPPLGTGGMPFEITTVSLEPDSMVAAYTKGLVRCHAPASTPVRAV
ncbi:SpoIIE family protein phosphatase [Streptomyces canus]|uniref:SpoIIE family protein phosphatase n=1 Tax=Streptomyces canus TaxID=58343 RepID=UPI0037214CCE